MRRIAVAATSVVLVGAALPATASALTRAQANAVAMRVLHPQAGKKNVILFGLPSALKAGTAVGPADPPKGKPGKKPKQRFPRLRHPAWLYWLDQVPFAFFSHKSRYLLVDDATGRVLKNARLGWYPSVNGKRPPFVAPKGYLAKRYHVFARVRGKKTRKQAFQELYAPVIRLFANFMPQAQIPPGALKGECVLIVSDYADPLFLNNYDAFSDWTRSKGIPTFFATGDGPDKIIPDSKAKAPNGETLRANVGELIAKQKCTDILIYLNGHGQDEGHGPAEVATRTKKVSDNAPLEVQAAITAGGLYDAMSTYPNTDFKVKIDSCFSGRFVDDYRAKVANGKLKNLKIIEASSPSELPSIAAIVEIDEETGEEVEVFHPDNPNNLSEFTNQNLTGLTKFFESQTMIDNAVAQGGSLMARALGEAFDLGADVNHAVDTYGIEPVRFTNFDLPKPDLRYIGAVFPIGPNAPEKFTTRYTAVDSKARPLTPQGLTFQWFVVMQADFPCAAGFTPNSPNPNQAKWNHADVSEGGPCTHAGTDHPGTVHLVVSNADWLCIALYQGTLGGQGPPAPPCTRR